MSLVSLVNHWALSVVMLHLMWAYTDSDDRPTVLTIGNENVVYIHVLYNDLM